jgi:methionyl aminopeptidase
MSTQREKTPAEIDAMRECGKILATIFRDLKAYVQPGMNEIEIDTWVAGEIEKHGAIATYKTSEVNFPGVICISVNEAITHGIPTDYVLQKGDVVGFDFVITYKGMKTDSAFTMVIGEEPKGAVKHLLRVTERRLYA